MDPERTDDKLSQIQTMWTALRQAHAGPTAGASDAQVRLLERYTPAIRRFLRGALRDPDAAADVFQDFVVRFLHGDFHRADPGRGRFRDFLATALRNLVFHHEKARKRRPESLTADGPGPEARAGTADAGPATPRGLAQVATGLAWEGLARHDRQTGQPLHLVLRFRADHPGLRSPEMAERLGARLGQAVSPEWVRKWLARARERFMDLFVEEVERSAPHAGPEALEQELVELGLLDACRDALGRRRESILWS